MKLYKVTGSEFREFNYPDIRFITAKNEAKALKKFISLGLDCSYTKVEFICERDKIVPTIDPIKEFKHD